MAGLFQTQVAQPQFRLLSRKDMHFPFNQEQQIKVLSAPSFPISEAGGGSQGDARGSEGWAGSNGLWLQWAGSSDSRENNGHGPAIPLGAIGTAG